MTCLHNDDLGTAIRVIKAKQIFSANNGNLIPTLVLGYRIDPCEFHRNTSE